jgi:hypothetical protein
LPLPSVSDISTEPLPLRACAPVIAAVVIEVYGPVPTVR